MKINWFNILSATVLPAFFGASLYCSVLNSIEGRVAQRERETVQMLQGLISQEQSRYARADENLFNQFWYKSIDSTNYLQREQDLDLKHKEIIKNYQILLPSNLENNTKSN